MSARSRVGRGWRGKTRRPARHARPSMLEVPAELRPADYGFPRVQLPASRPAGGRQVLAELGAAAEEPLLSWEQELLANSTEASPEAEAERAAYVQRLERSIAAVADDDTAPLDLAGLVLDEIPQPAAPVPSTPFLTAGAPGVVHEGLIGPGGWDGVEDSRPTTCGTSAPRAACSSVRTAVTCPACIAVFEPAPEPEPGFPGHTTAAPVVVHLGNALPAALTAPELLLLGRPIPADAPPAVQPLLPLPPAPVRRSFQHDLVFAAFDDAFWAQRNQEIRDLHASEHVREGDADASRQALLTRLYRLDRAHGAAIERFGAQEYRGRLADAIRPFPLRRRTPGAAKAEIDADAAAWHEQHPHECCPNAAGCTDCPLPGVAL